jgi:thiamine-phosphate pyrophosphorylase
MRAPAKVVDLRAYALLDPERAGPRSLADLAAILAPHVTLLQLRDKHGTTRAMVEVARAIRAAARQVPLLINDRVDVALAASADGVHIGQDDIAADDARRLLGDDAIIGLSLKTIRQAREAPLDRLDYVAIGGVFVTQSKDNPDPPVGLAGFKTILAAVRQRDRLMPVVAIAGIDAGNAADVIAAGADGVAVISALSFAADPGQAAEAIRKIVDTALAKRASS